MKVDGIAITETDGMVVTGFLQDDDTDEVTAAGLIGNAKPGRQWRHQDGWKRRTVTLTVDDIRAIDAIPDTFGRLFAVAEILAARGTTPED